MARQPRRSGLEQALAAYAALDDSEKMHFYQALIRDPRSPFHQTLVAVLEHHAAYASKLEKELRDIKRQPDAEDPYQILRDKEAMSWPRLALKLGCSVAAARQRHRRAKAKLARECEPIISVTYFP